MFYGVSSFNEPIGNWNVSNVTTLWETFMNATNFNQTLGVNNFGTGDDLPANFGTLTKPDGTGALITNWTWEFDYIVLSSIGQDTDDNSNITRYIKVTRNGSYITGSGRYKAGHNLRIQVRHCC